MEGVAIKTVPLGICSTREGHPIKMLPIRTTGKKNRLVDADGHLVDLFVS